MENFNFEELENVDIILIKEGDIITGKVLKVSRDMIYMDIGYKMEGKIEAMEFSKKPSIGEKLEVIVIKDDEINGDIILSHKQAKFIKAWNNVVEVSDSSPYISGKVVEKLEKGYKVDIGIPGFCPFSHIKRVDEFEKLKDKQLMFKILDINEKTKNVVLSRRLYLTEVNKKRRKEILESIEEGNILDGIVKNIQKFGVFIDLGGIDAFIPRNELSWSSNIDPAKIVAINDVVKGSVLSFKKNEEKIVLSLKKLQPNPWSTVDEKYQEGMIAKGTIVNIINNGVFIELEPGIEGYISKENLTWAKHIKTPFDVVKKNDLVEFKILNIDKANKKISLGLKQILPNPWDEIAQKYFVGQKLEVKIKWIVKNGAYVKIDDNIEGFIDLADVSWVKNFRSGKEAFKKGDKVNAVIADISKEEQLLKLSLKQLQINPWEIIKEKVKNKTVVTVKVIRSVERGTIVSLEDNIKGFIPISHYEMYSSKDSEIKFNKNDMIKCLIIDTDEKKKTAICSPKEYKNSIAQKEMAQYLKQEEDGTAKLGDLIKNKYNKGLVHGFEKS